MDHKLSMIDDGTVANRLYYLSIPTRSNGYRCYCCCSPLAKPYFRLKSCHSHWNRKKYFQNFHLTRSSILKSNYLWCAAKKLSKKVFNIVVRETKKIQISFCVVRCWKIFSFELLNCNIEIYWSIRIYQFLFLFYFQKFYFRPVPPVRTNRALPYPQYS